MVTTRPPKTIVKPTALGPVANTDTKLLIYGLFQKGRVLAQDGHRPICSLRVYRRLSISIPFGRASVAVRPPWPVITKEGGRFSHTQVDWTQRK